MTQSVNRFEVLYEDFNIEQRLEVARILEVPLFREIIERRFKEIEEQQLSLEYGPNLSLEYIILSERKTLLRELLSLFAHIAANIDEIMRPESKQAQ